MAIIKDKLIKDVAIHIVRKVYFMEALNNVLQKKEEGGELNGKSKYSRT